MRDAQQHGHFAEDQAGLRGGGDPHVVFQNFDRPLDQKIEGLCRLALLDDKLTGLKAAQLVAFK